MWLGGRRQGQVLVQKDLHHGRTRRECGAAEIRVEHHARGVHHPAWRRLRPARGATPRIVGDRARILTACDRLARSGNGFANAFA